MRSQQGFTIVELIAVITIISILAALAGPKLIGNDTFAARGAYGTLLSALRLAQKTAVAQRTTVYITLNTGTRVLCLGYTSNCSTAVIDPATKAAYSKTLPSTIDLTQSRTDLAFNSQGYPTSGSDTVFTITNNVASETARSITVWRTTGYAQ
jgi:MSHA pilin protein MshC